MNQAAEVKHRLSASLLYPCLGKVGTKMHALGLCFVSAAYLVLLIVAAPIFSYNRTCGHLWIWLF